MLDRGHVAVPVVLPKIVAVARDAEPANLYRVEGRHGDDEVDEQRRGLGREEDGAVDRREPDQLEAALVSLGDEELHVSVDAHHLCDLAALNRTFDVAFIVTKAYDAYWAAELINPYVKDGGLIVGLVIAFWLVGDRVVAGMNVNVWDVTDPIQRLIRERVAVEDRRLADPGVPLEDLLRPTSATSAGG